VSSVVEGRRVAHESGSDRHRPPTLRG
jgi:hypothetical protein